MKSFSDDTVYKISSAIFHRQRNDVLQIIRADGDELITLRGLSQSCFLAFDGKKNLGEVKKEIQEKIKGQEIDSDFTKLLEFLLKYEILQVV